MPRLRFLVLMAAGLGSLAPAKSPQSAPDTCEDTIIARTTVSTKLDCTFFHSTKTSPPWWTLEHECGGLEDTMDGTISAVDLVRLEHTAKCTSTHQGEHEMELCDAIATEAGAKLVISGGMPAFASSLTITLDQKLGYQCKFEAVYPSPTNPLKWRITKKELRLKSADLKEGARVYGWISVTFEEIDTITKEATTHKIEGFFKPVLQHKTP